MKRVMKAEKEAQEKRRAAIELQPVLSASVESPPNKEGEELELAEQLGPLPSREKSDQLPARSTALQSRTSSQESRRKGLLEFSVLGELTKSEVCKEKRRM